MWYCRVLVIPAYEDPAYRTIVIRRLSPGLPAVHVCKTCKCLFILETSANGRAIWLPEKCFDCSVSAHPDETSRSPEYGEIAPAVRRPDERARIAWDAPGLIEAIAVLDWAFRLWLVIVTRDYCSRLWLSIVTLDCELHSERHSLDKLRRDRGCLCCLLRVPALGACSGCLCSGCLCSCLCAPGALFTERKLCAHTHQMIKLPIQLTVLRFDCLRHLATSSKLARNSKSEWARECCRIEQTTRSNDELERFWIELFSPHFRRHSIRWLPGLPRRRKSKSKK